MESRRLCALAVDALEELKGVDIKTLDVHQVTTIADFMIIATGTSNRHVKALADSVLEAARAAGVRPTGIEGQEGGEWVLLDLADVIVHVMLPRVRDFYNLEKLWSMDAVAERAREH